MRVFLFCILVFSSFSMAQELESAGSNSGWFSLGVRSTVNLFDHDGTGIGSGGQFRIRLNDRLNTDWFADYITINSNDEIRSEYLHIGWSVLFYPLPPKSYAERRIQPYILAGHCFDYNKKTLIADPSVQADRWGSAVQSGLGFHFFLSERIDLSLTSQYMIHLTKAIDGHSHGNGIELHASEHSGLEGHLLTTVSLNYKICRLWKR
ncbi:MAG: hypothetical protein R3277_02865 [Brumimicrobium sp.]|nr:hypothetical protein [Brumimicrobium sp.]